MVVSDRADLPEPVEDQAVVAVVDTQAQPGFSQVDQEILLPQCLVKVMRVQLGCHWKKPLVVVVEQEPRQQIKMVV
jgi:hypothetical protein